MQVEAFVSSEGHDAVQLRRKLIAEAQSRQIEADAKRFADISLNLVLKSSRQPKVLCKAYNSVD
jgi:hypothetical protein